MGNTNKAQTSKQENTVKKDKDKSVRSTDKSKKLDKEKDVKKSTTSIPSDDIESGLRRNNSSQQIPVEKEEKSIPVYNKTDKNSNYQSASAISSSSCNDDNIQSGLRAGPTITPQANPVVQTEKRIISDGEASNKTKAVIPNLLILERVFQETTVKSDSNKQLDDSEWLKSFIQSSKSSSITSNALGKLEGADRPPPPAIRVGSPQNLFSPKNFTGPKLYDDKSGGRGPSPVEDISQSNLPRPYGASNNNSFRPIIPRRPSFTDGSVASGVSFNEGASVVSRISASDIFADDEKSETQSMVSMESFDLKSKRPPKSPGKSLLPQNKSSSQSLSECFNGKSSGGVNSISGSIMKSKPLKSRQNLQHRDSGGGQRMHKVDRFCRAALQGDLETLKLMLERYPELINKINSSRCSVDNIDRIGPPICWAAYGGDVEVTRFVLHSGAYVDDLDEFEWSPLMLAANLGHVGVVQLLLRNGADIEKTSKKGLNAQRLAMKRGHPRIVEMLARYKQKMTFLDGSDFGSEDNY